MDPIATMQLILQMADLAPEGQKQQFLQQAEALREQARQAQERNEAAAEQATRDASREDKVLMQKARQNIAIRELCRVTEKTTARKATMIMTAADDALAGYLQGAAAGESAPKLQAMRNKLAEVLASLSRTAPLGMKRYTRLFDALKDELGLSAIENDEEVFAVIPSTDSHIMPVIDDDDDEGDDESADLPDVEREQRPPSDYSSVPAKVSEAFDVIMGIEKLRKSIRFELVPFLRRVHDHIVDPATGAVHSTKFNTPNAMMLGGGKCQSRKTPLKACMFIMGRLLGVSTVLLTTGTTGRNDLFTKFTEMLQGRELQSPHAYSAPAVEFHYGWNLPNVAIPPVVRNISDAPWPTYILRSGSIGTEEKKAWAVAQLAQGACLVVNNSSQAMLGASHIIDLATIQCAGRGQPFQFLLIVDEADDFYRTEASTRDVGPMDDTALKMDIAMKALRKKGPLIKFDVSATLFAIYLSLIKMGRADKIPFQDIFYVESSSEYVGTDLLMPPEDAKGNPVFLSESELTPKNLYINHKIESLWDDAAKNGRALVLDATTAAVRARANIYDKAIKLLQRHPRAIAIVVSGGEIRWWTKVARPGHDEDLNHHVAKGKEKMIGKILNGIDKAFKDRPIFVFGYSQLMRGISYRSSARVPSHYALQYGNAMSICRLVQAAGRAHGEQASTLRANGFDRVQMLTKAHDFDTIKNYPSFLESIKNRMESGMNLEEAVTTQHAGKYDFSIRDHGQKKLLLGQLSQQVLSFGTTQPGDLLGAETEDLAVCLFSPKRVVIEVLKDGLGLGSVYDEDDAMTSKQILEELTSSPDYYSSFLGPGSTLPQTTPEVTQILKSCTRPLKSIRLDAPVECFLDGRSLRWYLNQTVIDELIFNDGATTDTSSDSRSISGLLPPPAERQMSASRMAANDDELQVLNEQDSQDAEQKFQFQSLAEQVAYDADLARALSNSEVHTSGADAVDQHGAGPSGV